MTDLPHRPTLFIDRNSGGKKLQRLIAEAIDIRVVLHDEHYKDGSSKVPDHVWLSDIGKLGWVIVTGDFDTLKSPLFLAGLHRSRARVFLLSALNGATLEGKAECIVVAWEKMLKISRDREPPLMWQFNKGGEVYSVDFKHKLGMLRRAGKTAT